MYSFVYSVYVCVCVCVCVRVRKIFVCESISWNVGLVETRSEWVLASTKACRVNSRHDEHVACVFYPLRSRYTPVRNVFSP